jgi:hypothetical protein
VPDCSSAERGDWMPRDLLHDAPGADGGGTVSGDHHQRVYVLSSLAIIAAALFLVAVLTH